MKRVLTGSAFLFLFTLSLYSQVIKVGLFHNPPLSIVEDQQITGIYPDLLKEIGRIEGWVPEYVVGEWADLLDSLQSGDIDLLISIAKTQERQKIFDFNNIPIVTAWGTLYKSKSASIDAINDVTGKRIAVMEGDVNYRNFSTLTKSLGITWTPVPVPGIVEGFKAVENGRADAVVSNNINGDYLLSGSSLLGTSVFFSPLNGFVAVPKGESSQIILGIDKWITFWKGTESSTYYQVLSSYYKSGKPPILGRGFTLALLILLLTAGIMVLWVVVLQAVIRKRTEKLKASEMMYRSLTQIVPAGIIIVQDGKFVFANESALNLFAIPSEGLQDVKLSKLIPQSQLSDVEHMLAFILKEHSYVKDEIIQFDITTSNTAGYAIISASYIKWEDEPAILCAFHDITRVVSMEQELKQARNDAEEAGAVRSNFIANISHELRTPLNGLLGLTSMLKTTDLSDKQAELVSMLDYSSENFVRIVEDILNFAELEQGTLLLEEVAIDLEDLGSYTENAFSLVSSKKSLDFRVEVNGAMNRVVGDRLRLTQVLYHLVSNAVKYTNEGSVKVSISGGASLAITVSDTGVGIPGGSIDEIFVSFRQLEEPYTKNHQGSGIGLSIVKGLVDAMNGTLEVQSTLGEGSVFTVTVPLSMSRRSQLPAVESEAGPATERDSSAEPVRIKRALIVEDEVINRLYLMRLMESFGFECVEARNGEEAIEAYNKYPFSVILMDIGLPGISGQEAVERIRTLEEENVLDASTVIAVTAYTSVEERRRFLSSGIDTVVGKPVREHELKEILF